MDCINWITTFKSFLCINIFRKRQIQCIILLVVVIILCFQFDVSSTVKYVYTSWERYDADHTTPIASHFPTQQKGKVKLIVIYSGRRWQNSSTSRMINHGKYTCKMTSNLNAIPHADGVYVDVFYLKSDKPPTRSHPDQVWVFYNKEPEEKIRNYHRWQSEHWRHFFNWTVSYRRDSDISSPYGVIVKKSKPVKNWLQIAKSKKRSVAWIVSNCHTVGRREDYVRKLKELGVQVDIYGYCGKLKLLKQKNAEAECFKNHRFYLSFESVFCEDYVTEKFFKLVNFDIMPIVRGGANYSQLFPPETFINTADFKSPEQLAKYLLYLDKNITAYAELLERKSGYRSKLKRPWPELCKRLHELSSYRKIYPDMKRWLKCRNPSGA
ncbi:alpha-(1,3)-fucosyltransferase C-like [Gigantopelta aegis]|uniref:alpha-(1,3)-fucosyltransferase C-like n=1 Tax=Gigantopelta aegis TaxID=1735272 RepID=UPI001B88E22E|nr:alpha-(1,3)-fucosyltransferase C-like [Gigantopelta aegis]XP_041373760.1 alpha-(1,3)-fucosyltransferase C-like [Gigantopelta aegis]XP_041373761.1 alpha-(1,3)-fucosyltransferase C-like [Gigantopelta aegis]